MLETIFTGNHMTRTSTSYKVPNSKTYQLTTTAP